MRSQRSHQPRPRQQGDEERQRQLTFQRGLTSEEVSSCTDPKLLAEERRRTSTVLAESTREITAIVEEQSRTRDPSRHQRLEERKAQLRGVREACWAYGHELDQKVFELGHEVLQKAA